MVQKTVPPPVETADEASASAASTSTAPAPTAAPKVAPAKPAGQQQAPDAKVVAGLLNEADQARIAILASLNGGPNINGAMKDDNGAPVDLNGLANRQGGISNSTGGLNLPGGAGGPIKPGQGPGGLQSLHGGDTGGAATNAGTATKVVPVGDVQYGGSSHERPRLQRRGRHPQPESTRAPSVVTRRGSESDPTPVGAHRHPHQGLPERRGRLGQRRQQQRPLARRSPRASPGRLVARSSIAPGASGSTISVPFNFVKQGG